MTTPSLTGMVTCKNLQVNNLLGITRVLRTCNGAEYQVKIFLSMPIYAGQTELVSFVRQSVMEKDNSDFKPGQMEVVSLGT